MVVRRDNVKRSERVLPDLQLYLTGLYLDDNFHGLSLHPLSDISSRRFHAEFMSRTLHLNIIPTLRKFTSNAR
ncbi:hypothetical protein Clacol_010229 [Clathrus columnatus]|uniref:Uncharacterized protein n=1 Tax=Clathrus columnatus TaxID=1419009 RepID=A0AAV5AT90_9AGAM|nr:hypothetical protein Clacol_010229 [Clathrus columnatus]